MLYNEKLIDSIKLILTEKKHTLSVAESVTSGYLQAAFSSAKEASKFFQGGITVYNAGQKCRHLNIEPIAAMQNDCVDEQVACQMAIEVNDLFISDYGISITGYAVRMPEKDMNDLYAYFAITNKKEVVLTKKITTDKPEGIQAQIDYTNQVIIEFEKLLNK
jgi:nicotinamide-nucleotide amidase